MNVETMLQVLHVREHLLAVLLGLPRLLMIIQTAPFMGGTMVTGQIRIAVALACYVFIHPLLFAQVAVPDVLSAAVLGYFAAIILKECLLGFLIAFLAGMLFWAVQCAGFFIDNQRGASMASAHDPTSGEETSPLGSLLFQCAVYLFFSGGAFVVFLGLVFAGYELWPVTAFFPTAVFQNMDVPLFFAGCVVRLMTVMALLAAPIVAACLLTDMALGLINRFASQLNVYVLGMPIKSAIAAFLLCLSLGLLLGHIQDLFPLIDLDLRALHRLFHE
jgi:type III secretion protein T